MFDVDLAGQQFPQLLHLVDNPAGKCRVGEECLPFGRQLGREVCDDRVAAARVMQLRAAERQPIDRIDPGEPVDRTIRDDCDTPSHSALRIDVEQVKPEDMKDEAQRERQAVVGEARQDEPDQHRAVTRQRGREDYVAASDTRIGLDRESRPEGDDDRDDIASQRVKAGFLRKRTGKDRSAKQPRDQSAEHQRSRKLKATARQERRATARFQPLLRGSFQSRLSGRVHESPVTPTRSRAYYRRFISIPKGIASIPDISMRETTTASIDPYREIVAGRATFL